MIRITLGVVICACVLVTASTLSLPENAYNQTEEVVNPGESHSVVKRNVLLNIWEGIQNFFSNLFRGLIAKSEDDEKLAMSKGMISYFSTLSGICSIGKFFGGSGNCED